jgi:hypothetical protein
MDNLNEAMERFNAEIATESLELDLLREHCFVDNVGETLVDAGEIDDFIRCSYKSKGIKVDGYSYNEDLGILTLVVAHYLDEKSPLNTKITKTEVQEFFKRCENFYLKSLKGLHEKIEIANEAHDLANLIKECIAEIHSVKIIFITDGIAPKQQADVTEVDGVEIKKIVWDIERILQFIETGEREPIKVDFVEMFGAPIPCLTKSDKDRKYTTYLAYVPGQCLADLYSLWGTRMLDMNVRVFLSSRGNVNKGIRDTIVNDPDMFCAYNNGITVFAREIKLVPIDGGQLNGISSAVDFQIVNGGQTIASLYHANKRYKADLSKISVQMKLISILKQEDIDHFVPRISEYSNTQNRVSMADLAANDPPHPELHEISKNLLAPDPTGGSRQTYWFYEKARGSYEETKRLQARTPAQQRTFEAKYPNWQKFDKGLFGKAWNTYLKKPHVVSLGSQKNFVNFNMWLKEQENEDLQEFFKKTVALVMLWKKTEKIVRRLNFEGYWHNIVTYTLSWLFDLTESKIDLDKIWRAQDVNESVLEAIEDMSAIVNDHIKQTDKNVTEWCKKQECWEKLKEKEYNLPSGIDDSYVDLNKKSKIYDSTIKAEKEIIEFCIKKGSDAWFELSHWLKTMGFLTGKARSQCFNMAYQLQRKNIPSIQLAIPCKKIWEDAKIRGWNKE